MITPTLKPLAALAVAATLAACDGVPIPDYPLSKSGAPESTLEIVNASGQPLRSLSYEGCNSLAKQTVLIEPGGPPSDKDRWVFPADSGQCILVSAYSVARDAYFSDTVRLVPGQTSTVMVR
ncbi:hypothetical protein [Celeribacter baekdonensis]|uniref:Lipoprotein n=1 Tax=Celeribacter baekdonensis TaxID=875171 RepID=A0A2R4M214_9RHOB|nr:hypothetical protein [Celeribacter baekdonensis]AVW91211.1 hypothetical protein DA792_09060 [Celeribacter baekdonensis]